MPKRIAMFNHKGGVGKTVTAFHIGWKLTESGARVLLVDGDSQVNLTALALGVDNFDEYYDGEETRLKNIKDGVGPVFEGRPAALAPFKCPTTPRNDRLFVLPGHAELAKYEGQLSLAQETGGTLSVLKNLPGALSVFIERIEELHAIDFTIIDLNPGLGAMNQNFFVACDAFVVPTNPDPFSLMAIGTLGEHVTRWVNWKRGAIPSYAGADYPLREGTPRFLGTINSRFNRHASKAAKKFDERIHAIDASVEANLVPALAQTGMLFKADCYKAVFEKWQTELRAAGQGVYALARVPDFQSLIHSATNRQLPIFAVTRAELRADGLAGNVLDLAEENSKNFSMIFSALCDKITYLLDDQCA